jgi:serine/threonine protein kinase
LRQPRISFSDNPAGHASAMSQQQDDDGTVIRPGAAASAVSSRITSTGGSAEGDPSGSGEDGLSLRIGARVAEFEITRRIGEGGFSIVYLAMDHSLERTVALKEYMPMSLATRLGPTQVQPRSERYRDTFEAGLKSFVNEAKLLAQFDHPSLVKVYRFWEANGTAYMVMPFYQGVTVKDTVHAMGRPPDEAWLMTLLGPLTQALAVIHAENCYHRDIAPDNVILLADGAKPLLLDFGAARRVIGDMTQALTVILKAGYAPVEQYAEIPGMRQGSWTDVYALAAVVYWAITGRTPPPSVGRMLGDTYVPLANSAAGRYSSRFLQAIDRALVVLPEQRTQTIEALRQDLGLSPGGSIGPVPAPGNDSDVTVIRPVGPARPRPADVTERIARDEVAPQIESANTEYRLPGTKAVAGDEPRTRPRRVALGVAAVGVALAIAAIWWALPDRSPQAPTAVAEKPRATSPEAPLASTPVAVDVPGTSASMPVAPSMAPVAAEASAPMPTAATAEPPTPVSTPSITPAEVPIKPAPTRVPGTPPRPERSTPTPAREADQGTPPRPTAAKSETVQADASRRAECGRIFQRLSLGENNAELIERLKTLQCR